jgi:hypothetical protein
MQKEVRGFRVRRRHVALGILVLLVLCSPLAIVLPSALHTNHGTSCGPKSRQAKPRSGPVSKATTHTVLTASDDSKTLTWSFDGDRNPTYWDVVITASPALESTDPRQIVITPSRIVRTDDHEAFKKPLTATAPTIRAGGKKVLFRVCADPEGLQAGTYTGLIDVDGAGDVTGTSLVVSVTARSGFWFGIGLWVVFGVIVVGLTFKSIADYQRALRGMENKTFSWWRAVTYIWRSEDLRILSTLIGIGTALISYAVLYNGDHTWGTDVWKSILAAAQGAFAAVGAQGVIDGFRGGGQQQAPESDATSSARVTSAP